MVFSWDLKDAAESIERRLGLSEFQTDGTEREKARDAKLKLMVVHIQLTKSQSHTTLMSLNIFFTLVKHLCVGLNYKPLTNHSQEISIYPVCQNIINQP